MPIWLICVIAAALFLFIPLIWRGANSTPSAGNLDFDAYYTAQDFVRRTYPGAQTFSSFEESVITSYGDTYNVGMRVRGLNAFGGPIENLVGVQMELDRGAQKWRLTRIKAQ